MSKKNAKDSADHFHDYGIHIPTRTIYIGSEGSENGDENGVDYLMAERAVKNLYLLDSASNEPITVILNTLGGDVIHGMSIYDAIKESKSHVTIKATGYVMSMGSLILQSGDSRLLSPSALVMVHHGTEAQEGHVKKVRSWVDFGRRHDKVLNQIYLDKIREKHPNFSLAKLDKLLDFDTILFASEAVELGLADGIYGR